HSLARPGGNVTGLFLNQANLAGKWLELIREAAPRTRRAGVLWDPATGSSQLTAARAAARALGLEIQVLQVRRPDGFDDAFAAALRAPVNAIVMLSSPLMSFPHSKQIAELATERHLPAISPVRSFAEAGGLMAYGPLAAAYQRRAAIYVDKILKGSKAADLPIEQPTQFSLWLN